MYLITEFSLNFVDFLKFHNMCFCLFLVENASDKEEEERHYWRSYIIQSHNEAKIKIKCDNCSSKKFGKVK